MLIVALVLAGTVDGMHAWARFSREPVLVPSSETVEIGTVGVEPGSRDLHLRMRLTRRRRGEAEISWADSATCPAVLGTVRAMSDLPVPRVASPYDMRGATMAIDGTAYSFEGTASGSNGRIAFSSNVGTPLAAWIDARLAALAACWKPAKP